MFGLEGAVWVSWVLLYAWEDEDEQGFFLYGDIHQFDCHWKEDSSISDKSMYPSF